MSKPPIAIRLIAWALIVLGTLSISEILVQFFLYDRIHLDVHVFLVPIGMGLLRRSETSRWWASVFLGLWSFGGFYRVGREYLLLILRAARHGDVRPGPSAICRFVAGFCFGMEGCLLGENKGMVYVEAGPRGRADTVSVSPVYAFVLHHTLGFCVRYLSRRYRLSTARNSLGGSRYLGRNGECHL